MYLCGKTKTQFVKCGASGGSFLHTFMNKLPFELNLPGHNFTCSGTKLNKRLNSDGTPKEWSIPINRVDNTAYHDDLCYSKYDNTNTRNHVCDCTILNELNEIMNPTLRKELINQELEKRINAKVNFGLGATIKTKKNPKIY